MVLVGLGLVVAAGSGLIGSFVTPVTTDAGDLEAKQTSINPNLARRIAQEAGVKIVEGALYGDSLGPPGSGADTLDGMLKYNTDTIVTNLK